MSQPSKSVQRVRSIRLASPKKTLILEAEPDRNVYEVWLGQLASGLPSALITPARKIGVGRTD